MILTVYVLVSTQFNKFINNLKLKVKMSETINTSSKDVEMKDETKKVVPAKKEAEPIDPFYGKYFIHSIIKVMLYNFMCLEFRKNLVLLEKAAKDKDSRMSATLTK
jgi:hypothetical protein